MPTFLSKRQLTSYNNTIKCCYASDSCSIINWRGKIWKTKDLHCDGYADAASNQTKIKNMRASLVHNKLMLGCYCNVQELYCYLNRVSIIVDFVYWSNLQASQCVFHACNKTKILFFFSTKYSFQNLEKKTILGRHS